MYHNNHQAFRGISRNVQWQQEEAANRRHVGKPDDININPWILTFRVEQVDASGNITSYIAVDFATWQFQNIVADGDHVEVIGVMNPNNALSAVRVINLNTNVSVGSDDFYISTGPDRSFIGRGLVQSIKNNKSRDKLQIDFTLASFNSPQEMRILLLMSENYAENLLPLNDGIIRFLFIYIPAVLILSATMTSFLMSVFDLIDYNLIDAIAITIEYNESFVWNVLLIIVLFIAGHLLFSFQRRDFIFKKLLGQNSEVIVYGTVLFDQKVRANKIVNVERQISIVSISDNE
jgi:hypothetical protein